MANFGNGVSALIETYSRCLRLLKLFGGQHSGADSIGLTLDEVQSLRGSIRSDRSQVRRAYSSRLSKSGNRLEKGDSRAKSALQRILKRLKNAIQSLVGSSKTKNPAFDYGSLVSLSSSSRADTIRTIDDLSIRLSSASLVHKKHASRSSAPHHGSRHSRRVGSKEDVQNGKSKTTRSQGPSSSPPRRHGELSEQDQYARRSKSITSNHHGRHHSSASLVTKESRHTLIPRGPSRNSYTSGSSGSTKLGEIPQSGRHRMSRASDTAFHVARYDRPVYPLQPFESPPKKKQGLLRRIFRP
ncbi:hypothetical protein E8E14_004306 [Neopestalotiopsis sp. 37M]|nr:hypothetical protein E8E14_004306 [Neopestalotiopsis sp. 37M]